MVYHSLTDTDPVGQGSSGNIMENNNQPVSPEASTQGETPTDASRQGSQVEQSTQQQTEQPQEPGNAPKTFTQEDVDRIVQTRVSREAATAARKMRELQVQLNEAKLSNASDEERQQIELDRIVAERVEQELNSRTEKQVRASFEKRVESFAKENPDYHQVVTHNHDLPISTELARVIAEHEIGPKLAYHLGKNPEVAHELSVMPPVKAALRLGEIAVQIQGSTTKTTTSTPAPIKPVGGKVSPKPVDLNDPSTPVEDWIKARNAQRRT